MDILNIIVQDIIINIELLNNGKRQLTLTLHPIIGYSNMEIYVQLHPILEKCE